MNIVIFLMFLTNLHSGIFSSFPFSPKPAVVGIKLLK